MKILMVEDDPAFASLIQEILDEDREMSYEIFNAETLREGIDILTNEAIDIVLLDLELPDSQGIDSIRMIQETSEVSIVILTGLSDKGVAIDALSVGAEDYLIKTNISPPFLIRSLRYAVERSNYKKELTRYRDHLEDMIAERTDQLKGVNEYLLEEIGRRKRSEQSYIKANRALKTHSECNKALIHSVSEKELLNNIGKIIVNIGEYPFVWVGFSTDSSVPEITPVASAGVLDPEILINRWASVPWEMRPEKTVICTGKPLVIRNISRDPRMKPVQEDAASHGLLSMISLPIQIENQAKGFLGIYASEPDSFDAQEISLLQELASDLGFGIESIRTRERRRSVELKLSRSEKKYRQLVERAQEGIWVMDPEGQTTYANPKMIEMLGYSGKEMARRPLLSYLPAGTPPEDFFIQPCLQGMNEEREQELIRKDGSSVYTNIAATPIITGKGKITGILALVSDITEQTYAKEALQESETRFKQVVENAGEWIWEVDATGLYTYSSMIVERMLGYQVHEVIGKIHFYDLFPPDTRDKMKDLFFTLFSQKKPFLNLINSNLHKKGDQVIIRTSAFPMLDKNGDLLGYRGLDLDITTQVKSEMEIKRAIEQINLNIGTFSILNDQIRNPLTIIATLTDELDNGIGERILTQIRVIDSIINQLDQGWVESDKVRAFLRKHYGIITKHDLFHSLN